MIDLRFKGLPNTVCVNGKSFLIKTDFREWLKFGELIKKTRPYKEYFYLFEKDIPTIEFFSELMNFYLNPNSTPIDIGSSSNKKLLDWIEDGEYVVSSYLAIYDIDLIQVDNLHWHKFQALFRGLPDDSKIMQIMGYRAYKKSNKNMEEQYQKQCDMWTFQDSEELERQQQLLDEFNKL